MCNSGKPLPDRVCIHRNIYRRDAPYKARRFPSLDPRARMSLYSAGQATPHFGIDTYPVANEESRIGSDRKSVLSSNRQDRLIPAAFPLARREGTCYAVIDSLGLEQTTVFPPASISFCLAYGTSPNSVCCSVTSVSAVFEP